MALGEQATEERGLGGAIELERGGERVARGAKIERAHAAARAVVVAAAGLAGRHDRVAGDGRVGRVDAIGRLARVPALDRAVELDAGVRAVPRRLADRVPQLTRAVGLVDLARGAERGLLLAVRDH